MLFLGKLMSETTSSIQGHVRGKTYEEVMKSGGDLVPQYKNINELRKLIGSTPISSDNGKTR